MIRIYQEFEFPRGYIDTMKMNGINPANIRWVIDDDDRNYGTKILAERLGRYEWLGTVTDHSIFVIYW